MQSSLAVPAAQPDPIEQIPVILQTELSGLFQVTSVTSQSRGKPLSFGGRFLRDPDRSYDEIHRRFQVHGYTPLLRRKRGEAQILAVEGLLDRPRTGNPLINLLLFVATILTTLSAGAQLAGADILGAIMSGSIEAVVNAVLAGAPFTIALLGILGVHELGHYAAAQLHGVRATLPYFIPLPLVGIGTLGAFISIKSPMKDRKVLFDIGLAGPYAGFMVSVPLMLIGLLLSTHYVSMFTPGLTLERLGSSILVYAIVELFTDIPAGQTLALHPIFFAAWLGFFLTGLNLLPAGQLDGGHAAYALLGRAAHAVALLTFLLLIVAGIILSPNWYIWAFFVMLSGLRHPPPMNDISDVGLARKAVGLCTLVLFLIVFVPMPFG